MKINEHDAAQSVPTDAPITWTTAQNPNTLDGWIEWSKYLQACLTRHRTVHQTSVCDVLESLTQVTTKQRYEVSWHPGSDMTGQLLFGKIHWKKWEEPSACIRAPQGHASKQADTRKFTYRLVEKGFASFLYHLGTAKNESSITSDGIIP